MSEEIHNNLEETEIDTIIRLKKVYDEMQPYKAMLANIRETVEIDFEKEEKLEPKIIPIWQRTPLRVAAAILLLVVGYMAIMPFGQSSSNQALYKKYENNYTTPLMKSIAESVSSRPEEAVLYEVGYKALQKKDYTKAIDLLTQLKDKMPLFWPTYLYRGEAYLKNGETEKALEDFKTALEYSLETDVAIKNSARWWLLMTYLKQNDKAAAHTLIKQALALKSFKQTIPQELIKWSKPK